MNRRFVFTGGPGGGKTTILGALAEREYLVFAESARRIIKERLAKGLEPRPDPILFARKILQADIENYRQTTSYEKAVFFDRGVLDALYMLDAEGALKNDEIGGYVRQFPYNPIVFLLPPWEDVYSKDSERDQSFDESVQVFEGMRSWYSKWGYETIEVPRDSLTNRQSFILNRINKQ